MRVISAHDILTTRNCTHAGCENDAQHGHPLCSVCQTLPPTTLRHLGPEARCNQPTKNGNPCHCYPTLGFDQCWQHRSTT